MDIFIACEKGDLEFVKKYEGDVNVKYFNGWTPLHFVSSNSDSNLKIVKYLVEKGADINVKSNNGWTPLYIASFTNHLKIVKYLFSKGADVNVKSIHGYTPLGEASCNNNIEIVKYLLDCGAERIEIKSEWSVEVKEILMTY